ncbi:DUF2642 domain-containing protein, partial [Bacillus sp. SIMBA_069]
MELELAGNMHEAGILIEESSDIIVLYTGKVYRYIPFRHIKNISFPMIEEEFGSAGELEIEETSFRKLLINAKG